MKFFPVKSRRNFLSEAVRKNKNNSQMVLMILYPSHMSKEKLRASSSLYYQKLPPEVFYMKSSS